MKAFHRPLKFWLRTVPGCLLLASEALGAVAPAAQQEAAPIGVRIQDIQAVSLLTSQRALLKNLNDDVEEADRLRFEHLLSTTSTALDTIKTNSLIGRDVSLGLQLVITEYRGSVDFFRQVQTENSRARLIKLIQNNERLAEIYGYDLGSRSLVTASIFHQLHALLLSADKLPFDSTLKTRLLKLNPGIGYVLALAEQGDTPAVLNRAQEFVRNSRATLNEIEKLGSSTAGFDIYLEIQQMLEFFKAFSDYREAP